MILLTSTSDLVEVTTSSTQSIMCQASYVDLLAGTTVTPARTNTLISSATTTTVVGSPSLSTTQRTLKYLSIYNAGAAAETVTVKHTDGTNVVTLASLSLGVGFTLCYNEGSGWTTYDASGNIQQSVGPGRYLKTTVILNGTTTFTTGTATNSIKARMVAGGGGGGGCPATSGDNAGGGGGGSYAEWAVAVSPSTAYTCAVGAGGTGVSDANGNTGGVTTLTISGVTVTCNGGLGGVVGAAAPVLGGAGGAISTNGSMNIAGAPGWPSSTGVSGIGGDSPLGAGGQGKLTASAVGNAATGFGAGGGGAASAGATEVGGAGSNGVIIIDEYS